jgi:hypothetical protein
LIGKQIVIIKYRQNADNRLVNLAHDLENDVNAIAVARNHVYVVCGVPFAGVARLCRPKVEAHAVAPRKHLRGDANLATFHVEKTARPKSKSRRQD